MYTLPEYFFSGYTIGISDEIAGLTILAVGVSIPELIFGVVGVQKGDLELNQEVIPFTNFAKILFHFRRRQHDPFDSNRFQHFRHFDLFGPSLVDIGGRFLANGSRVHRKRLLGVHNCLTLRLFGPVLGHPMAGKMDSGLESRHYLLRFLRDVRRRGLSLPTRYSRRF